MSEFSTAYQEFVSALASFEYANSVLLANTDPEAEEALINDVKDKANVLSALDQEVSNTLAQVQNSIFDETEQDEDSGETTTELLATLPLKLTTSSGNEHPRLAIDDKDNIWLVWHSRKTGNEEIYVAKYFGGCGVWGTSGQGGEEIKITNFGPEGRRATYPNVAAGPNGEIHVVFQGESEDGSWEVYYSQSTGGGKMFSAPTRITESPGHALMPDVVVSESEQDDLQGSISNVVVVWHDDRFGAFEIMVAEKTNGSWESSGQGGTDTRLTQSAGNSMFPRIDGDKRGNLRVVYHDSRRGEGQTGIYMSTFVSTTGSWDSSAMGGSDRLVSNGPVDSLHPDIAIDHTGGISVAWHDLRHAQEDPDQHEEVYALYCPKMGHPGVHFPPLVPNVEARLDMDFEIMDCVNFQTITLTNAPEVCLAIRAPNATFWRGANEDGQYSNWQEFRPNFDLETMTVPWTLICVGGRKQVCIQVQDAEMVGFPVCREVTLALQPPGFQVEFFEDESMTIPLQLYQDRPVAQDGDVYVKLTTESPQILPPTFDVTSRGQYLIFNQETKALDLASGFSGSAGIGSFIGETVDLTQQDDASPAGQAFSAASSREFGGRFNIRRHDGLLNVDGSARLIVKPRDVCGEVGASQSDQDVASGIEVIGSGSSTVPDLPGGLPDSNMPTLPPDPQDPPGGGVPSIPPPGCTPEQILTKTAPGAEWYRFGLRGMDRSFRWQDTLPGPYGVAQLFTPPGRARILRARFKVVRVNSPGTGHYLGIEIGGISANEPPYSDTVIVEASSIPSWTYTTLPNGVPIWPDASTIPVTTVNFSGNTITHNDIPENGISPKNFYWIILRDIPDPSTPYANLDVDPPGSFSILGGQHYTGDSKDFSIGTGEDGTPYHYFGAMLRIDCRSGFDVQNLQKCSWPQMGLAYFEIDFETYC